MELEDKKFKTCTSIKKFRRNPQEENELCGTTLLQVMTTDGKEGPWICPDCDSLEHMPKKMRERIFEQ